MNILKTEINDLVIIEPNLFKDQRGYFFESFNREKFKKEVANVDFIQDNESRSTFGVLRGLHFQKPPFEQAKLVRCIQGEVLDVAVDLRSGSETFGKYVSVLLSEENKKQFFIPRGFAHGFVVLSESATFTYKVDNCYSPNHDSGIIWNDQTLNIDWKVNSDKLIISDKDKNLPNLLEFDSLFHYL